MYRELEPDVKASYERRATEGKKRDGFLRKVLEMGSSVPADQVLGGFGKSGDARVMRRRRQVVSAELRLTA